MGLFASTPVDVGYTNADIAHRLRDAIVESVDGDNRFIATVSWEKSSVAPHTDMKMTYIGIIPLETFVHMHAPLYARLLHIDDCKLDLDLVRGGLRINITSSMPGVQQHEWEQVVAAHTQHVITCDSAHHSETKSVRVDGAHRLVFYRQFDRSRERFDTHNPHDVVMTPGELIGCTITLANTNRNALV
jgi:hypothetical protein